MIQRALALAILFLLVAPAMAAAPACFEAPERVVVTEWSAPLTAKLEDGRRLRLVDINTDGDVALPTGRAQSRLVADAEADRWGRVRGDVVFDDTPQGLRHQLVADGLAFVDPVVMSKVCLEALLATERRAENMRRGRWPVWSDRNVLAADQAIDDAHVGRHVLVVGRVRSIGQTRRTVYLNFGQNYRTDFTVIIRRRDADRWPFDVTALAGDMIRVRGVLEAWNGGVITARHPAQIERVFSPAR